MTQKVKLQKFFEDKTWLYKHKVYSIHNREDCKVQKNGNNKI